MKKIFLFPAMLFVVQVFAQNDRANDYNKINWLQTFNTISINEKWSLHLEYQLRRTDGLKYWQQSLLRMGANYKLNDAVTAHIGYGWIETFPYGDYPIASAGTFPEHRLYEQLTFKQPINKWTFLHRFRTEQRWLGKVKADTISKRDIESWTFLYRFRYQFRAQYAIWKKDDQQLYGVFADELFIGAGKNLGVNIFDQNRIFLLLGYKLNKKLSIEGGYINQILQQGRQVNGKTIIQRNNGLVFGSYLNL